MYFRFCGWRHVFTWLATWRVALAVTTRASPAQILKVFTRMRHAVWFCRRIQWQQTAHRGRCLLYLRVPCCSLPGVMEVRSATLAMQTNVSATRRASGGASCPANNSPLIPPYIWSDEREANLESWWNAADWQDGERGRDCLVCHLGRQRGRRSWSNQLAHKHATKLDPNYATYRASFCSSDLRPNVFKMLYSASVSSEENSSGHQKIL